MAGYQYTVSLRIYHPSRDLTDVGTVLGRVPNSSGLVGTPRTNYLGRPLPGVWEYSFWMTRLVAGSYWDRDLPTIVSECLDDLSAHQRFLREIADDGGRLEFWIGWFFDEGNSGGAFSPDLLARLADLRMALSFDVYDHVASEEPRLQR